MQMLSTSLRANMITKILCLIVICVFIPTHSVPTRPSSLQQVHVLFRHGDRTPDKVGMYPTDPHLNDTYYPYGLGALTNVGKKQLLDLGRSLRRRYNTFLGAVYYPDIMEARCTSIPRAKISLQLVLAGLWPPTSLQKFDRSLPWQPINFNYVPFEHDKLLGFPVFRDCKPYLQDYIRLISGDEVDKFLTENKEKIDHINSMSGLNCSTLFHLSTLYFGLFAEAHTNRKLPKWTDKVYPKFLESAAMYEYALQTATDNMIKYGAGHLVEKILNEAKNKTNEDLHSQDKKIFLYSGHDMNIAHTLRALKSFKPHVPVYASHIIFEVHRIDSEYGFKIYYNDPQRKLPETLRLPGCEEFCPIEQFEKLVKNVLPDSKTSC